MIFAVLMYTDPGDAKRLSADELDRVAAKHRTLVSDLTASGELLNGAGLVPPAESAMIRWNAGDPIVGMGPVAGSREQLTAYYVIECADEQRALTVAEGILDFHVTAVEVRVVHDSVGLTNQRPGTSPLN